MCWRESLLLVPSEIGREILEKFHQVRIRCCTKSKNSTSAAPCASNLGENFTYRLSLCNPFIPFTGCIVVSLWSLLVTGCCWQDLHDLETAVCFLSHFMRLHLIVHKSLLQTCPDWFEESMGDICPAGTIPGYRSFCRTPEQLCGSVTSPPVRAELKGSWHDEQSLAWEREFWWQSLQVAEALGSAPGVAPVPYISVKWGVGREITQWQCQRGGNSLVLQLLQECCRCWEHAAPLWSWDHCRGCWLGQEINWMWALVLLWLGDWFLVFCSAGLVPK